MWEKKYPLGKLTKINNTYNEMIEFLKSSIPSENHSELLQKFEELALEDDKKALGLRGMYKINEFATIVSILSATIGLPGVIGVALATAPYTLMYYIMCKHTMLSSKEKKETCLRYMQSVSENENKITYPFEVGDDGSCEKMKKYLEFMKDAEKGNFKEAIKNITLDNEEKHL